MSYSWGSGHNPADTGRLPAVRFAYDATPATPAESLPRLAAELAPMIGVWQRLLARHQPDGSGRCRTCTKGGTGLPSTPWPCSIHSIAELARRRHGSQRT